MQFGSDSKKKPYSPPKATRVTLEQAKQFVSERAHVSPQEAMKVLHLLCATAEEQRQIGKHAK
jgi:hypothetical protein